MDLIYDYDKYQKVNGVLVYTNETEGDGGHEGAALQDVIWFGTVCTVAAAGLIVNLILLIAIKKSPRLKAPIFQLLFAIAIADVLLLVAFATPEIGKQVDNGKWVFGSKGCILLQFLHYLPTHVSSCLIVVGCWERFYAVCRPHSTLGWITSRKMSGIIAIIFIINTGVLIPVLVMNRPVQLLHIEGPNHSEAEACKLEMPEHTAKLYFTIMGMIFYGITAILSLALSVATICKACRIDLENYFIKDDFKNHIMRCVVAVTIISIVLWLPYRYVYFSRLHGSEEVSSDLKMLAKLMVLLCASVKPIVYVVGSSQFRKAIVRALKCCERRNIIDFKQTHEFKMHERFLPPDPEQPL